MALIIDLVETPTVLVALVVFLSTVLFVQYILASEWGENWFAGDKNPPPKGPREWPIIGCALSLLGDEPQKIFANMARSYGPIFRTRVGMIPTVVLSDFGLIREAFAKSGDDFADRPRLGVMEYITKGRGKVICTDHYTPQYYAVIRKLDRKIRLYCRWYPPPDTGRAGYRR